ncbi:MAG TPA: monovalent cation/H+ antiporter subunit D family protein, partial [Gammaproteobacteria bacterium]|nr:monovalent cation/H+ antiporter subunit D family protein [Gammaproteobacteria bacterium]
SKWYLISATFASGPTGVLLVAVIVISSLMAVVYIWRVVESAYFGATTDDQAVAEAPLALLIPTWTAVLLNLYFGLFPDIPLQLSSSAAETLLWHQP